MVGTRSHIRVLGIFIAFQFALNNILISQNNTFTVSGYVYDAISRESLPGANVSAIDTWHGSAANSYGFYSIRLPEGTYSLVFSFVGYQQTVKKVDLKTDIRIDVFLNSSILLDIVEVQGRIPDFKSPLMSRNNIPVQSVRNLPTLLGEKDLLKTIQLLPGVQPTREGSTGFHVRGGGNDQNLIIIDEAIVYNTSHVFGLFSPFNGDAIKDATLIKGGFPARYGGRLSSVLDITMRDGNLNKMQGEAGIGLTSSRLVAEGPLIKNKAGFLVAARRSYVDLILRAIAPPDEDLRYYFYDFNVKLNYILSKNHRLFLSSYMGENRFSVRYNEPEVIQRSSLSWQNRTATIRWNHIINNKMFGNASFILSDYKMNIRFRETAGGSSLYELDYANGINDISLKYDLHFSLFPMNQFRIGAKNSWLNFTPNSYREVLNSPETENGSRVSENVLSLKMVESAIYIENEVTWEKLGFNMGLRLVHTSSNKFNRVFAEPRINLLFQMPGGYTIKSSYARMNQSVHVLSNFGSGLTIDLYLPASELVKPQMSEQVALGVSRHLNSKGITLSLEGFFKNMNNVLAYRPGQSFISFDDLAIAREIDWNEIVFQGKGMSKGIEFMIQRNMGPLNGWIAYSISKSELQFDGLNKGIKFPSSHDRRHNLSVSLIWDISPRVRTSANWVFSSGSPITLPVGSYLAFSPSHYFSTGGPNRSSQIDYPGMINNFRMSDYHRLDLGIQFIKTKRWGTRTWEVGLYNAYNRKNPYYYFFREDYITGERKLKKRQLLPLIPSITYSHTF